MQLIIVPAVSAMLGGVASFFGTHLAMRIELAILRERITGLVDSIANLREDIDGAHRRIDSLLTK